MPKKSAYIYAKRRFQETAFSICMYGYLKKKIWWIGPCCFSTAMEIRAGHRAPRPTPEDQTSCSGRRKTHKNKPGVHTILLKVMTSVLCLKITKTGMDDWTAASGWSNRWMRFPSPNLQKRHGSSGASAPHYSTNAMLLKDTCLSCKYWPAWGERWVKKIKERKKKMESSFPSPPVAAAAADVDQRKVTEGKTHIEKALGNIWCRRQSRLYHPLVEKK